MDGLVDVSIAHNLKLKAHKLALVSFGEKDKRYTSSKVIKIANLLHIKVVEHVGL